MYFRGYTRGVSDQGGKPHREDRPGITTQLLINLTKGDRGAVDALLPLVYSELRSLAGNYLRRERADHTLQPTALVHEAYLRLVDQTQVNWQNRAHFFGVAAQMMRRILVDHARAQLANKRGGNLEKVAWDETVVGDLEASADLIDLDEALQELAAVDEVKSRIVELRYFGGLTVEETAEAMGVTPITIKRHWRLAKAFLYDKLRTKKNPIH